MALQKILGILFLLIGVIIFVLALSADFISLGVYPGYGYKQMSGIVVGAIAIIAGVYFTRQK